MFAKKHNSKLLHIREPLNYSFFYINTINIPFHINQGYIITELHGNTAITYLDIQSYIQL